MHIHERLKVWQEMYFTLWFTRLLHTAN